MKSPSFRSNAEAWTRNGYACLLTLIFAESLRAFDDGLLNAFRCFENCERALRIADAGNNKAS